MKLEGWTEDPKVVSNAYWNATPAATEAAMKVKGENFVKGEDELEIGTAARPDFADQGRGEVKYGDTVRYQFA